MSNNAHELSNRLLNALDNNYNVVDMHTVNEIISILEKFNITKELLETTRLGKHVNELRRKTSDATLARRAKVLVKRWRDLVIPTVASPAHTGSNRSSAERSVRRLGGTPLTSPALSRVVSPAVQSPRPPSRPAWGGYESDSQDVILVDDEPPAPAPAPPPPLPPPPITTTVKRPPSPEPLYDDKKAKRDKKPKKRRGHSRAGSGSEAAAAVAAAVGGAAWRDRNGSEARRNGCRDTLDPYTALVHRIPPAGAKKVKTTKELLEQIQSRGARTLPSPPSPGAPHSPDVQLIEPEGECAAPVPAALPSPVRNGGASPARSPSPDAGPECTCGEEEDPQCPRGAVRPVLPVHVAALHTTYVPGVNGTRAPALPHAHAARTAADPLRPGLFASVVPLYKYTDYADDYLVKNMSRVDLCPHLPWSEWAPPPPSPPPRPPLWRRDDEEGAEGEERPVVAVDVKPPVHRTVERTKEEVDGALGLMEACGRAVAAAPCSYCELDGAPVGVLPESGAALQAALAAAQAETERDALQRPVPPARFAEWHESARLRSELVALPYVLID